MKYDNEITLVGVITDGDETVYRSEIQRLESYSRENNLVLNIDKTTEKIMDFRKLEQ